MKLFCNALVLMTRVCVLLRGIYPCEFGEYFNIVIEIQE